MLHKSTRDDMWFIVLKMELCTIVSERKTALKSSEEDSLLSKEKSWRYLSDVMFATDRQENADVLYMVSCVLSRLPMDSFATA